MNIIDAEVAADLIEIDIAGLCHGAPEVDRAMNFPVPVAVRVVGQLEVPDADTSKKDSSDIESELQEREKALAEKEAALAAKLNALEQKEKASKAKWHSKPRRTAEHMCP